MKKTKVNPSQLSMLNARSKMPAILNFTNSPYNDTILGHFLTVKFTCVF